MRAILVGSAIERARLKALLDDGNGAQVRAREGAARGMGRPQATEPGFGAEPHVIIDVVGEFASLADARAAALEADAIVVAKKPSEPRADFEEALTPREIEVLELLAQGLPNKAIAARLGISDQTVKFHVSSIPLTISSAHAMMTSPSRNPAAAAGLPASTDVTNTPDDTAI